MNTLSELTDEELIVIDRWHKSLTAREQDTVINRYSTKFAYHLVRLLLEAEQILIEHDLDIERNSEILKSIRRGEWSEQKLRSWFDEKEKHLEELYIKSDLRSYPNEEEIKQLLLTCLEQHYGSLDNAIKREVPVEKLINELKLIVEKYS